MNKHLKAEAIELRDKLEGHDKTVMRKALNLIEDLEAKLLEINKLSRSK